MSHEGANVFGRCTSECLGSNVGLQSTLAQRYYDAYLAYVGVLDKCGDDSRRVSAPVRALESHQAVAVPPVWVGHSCGSSASVPRFAGLVCGSVDVSSRVAGGSVCLERRDESGCERVESDAGLSGVADVSVGESSGDSERLGASGCVNGLKKKKKPGQRQRKRLQAQKGLGGLPVVASGRCDVGVEVPVQSFPEASSSVESADVASAGSQVPPWRVRAKPQGFCETVVSQASCPSYGTALSEAEREAKESLARRRAAENAVAEKLAKMKLASLEDEKRCQEYADLKRSRIVQWTNEAVAKSQQSLEKCKTIDPSSSNSQADIRAQALELDHVKKELQNVMAVFMMEGPFEERMAALQQLENRETTSEYIKAQGECWAEMRPCSVDPGSDDVKLDVPYKPNRFRVLRNSELDSDLRL